MVGNDSERRSSQLIFVARHHDKQVDRVHVERARCNIPKRSHSRLLV
jgi:hypothetical protein